jgi:hypothetical protein
MLWASTCNVEETSFDLPRSSHFEGAHAAARVQARKSKLSRQYGSRLEAAPQERAFYQRLRSSDDVSMALMVRASRNLPIRLLAGEYERILRRRLACVGGSPDDAALAQMVDCFRWPCAQDLRVAACSCRDGSY